MKNFMAVVLIALLSGCGSALKTDNPHYQNAQAIAITTVSAIGGYKLLGNSVLGGLIAGAAGYQVARGIQWQPGDDEYDVVHVGSGQYPSQYGLSGYGYGNVVCDRTPDRFGWQPDPGMCKDGMGGQTTYEDLVRRARRDAGYYSAPQAPVVAQQRIVPPSNLWERPEKRQQEKQAESKKVTAVVGPTVNNYLDEPMIQPSCKTKNYGADGKCLKGFVDGLVLEQRACEGETKQAKCPTEYNPGKWAGIYQRLSNDLLERQKQVQGGDFAAK